MVASYTIKSNKKYSNKIERIQYSASILIDEAKMPLIRERAKLLGNKFMVKTLKNKNSLVFDELQYVRHGYKNKNRKRILNHCINNMSKLVDSANIQDNLVTKRLY